MKVSQEQTTGANMNNWEAQCTDEKHDKTQN